MGTGRLSDPAELIVSEFVTNSVQPSIDKNGRPGYGEDGLPVVHLRLACEQTCVLIEVWDSNPRPRPDEEHGRGLALIQALSGR